MNDLEKFVSLLRSFGLRQCECKRVPDYAHYPNADGDFLVEKISTENSNVSEELELFENGYRLVIYPKHDEDYNYLHVIFDEDGKFNHFYHSGEWSYV